MRLFAAAMMVLFSTAASGQTPRPPQTFPMFLQAQYATLKRNITGSAEKMPAEHFSFRPAPEVMTYAELIAHVLDVQYGYCAAVIADKGDCAPFIRTTVKTRTVRGEDASPRSA